MNDSILQSKLLSETEHLRKMADDLMKDSADATSADRAALLERVAQALKTVSDIDRSQVEVRKLAMEEEKLRYDLKNASNSERLERRQKIIGALAPAVTALMLVASFSFSTYQFFQSTRDKREAEEKSLWSDTIKMVSDVTTHSPVGANLGQFINKKEYAVQARAMAIEVLTTTHDPIVFEDLFKIALMPVQWTNFDEVMRLDRILGPRLGYLYDRTNEEGKKDGSLSNLTPEERREYDFLLSAVKTISNSVAPLLKGPRPESQTVDLTSSWITDCDWSGVNLSKADIENINLQNATLKGANLDGITSFNRAYFYATAWWEANRIDPLLLKHLKQTASYEQTKDALFGPHYIKVSPEEYRQSLAHLENASK
jgi:hypothetical protein